MESNVYSLSKASPLSGAEQIRLARRAHAGDERARRRLVETNMRLVFSIASKHRGEGIAFEDLISEGTIGLLEGIRRFDPQKGYKLSTYATFWIRHAVLDAWLWHGRTIRLPKGVHDDLHTLSRAREELLAVCGREPTPEELTRTSSLSLSRVAELLKARRHTLSLEVPAERSDSLSEGGERSALGALMADGELGDEPVDGLLREELEAALADALKNLPEIESYIISARYGMGGSQKATLKHLAAALGMSKEGVRQRQRSAEVRLEYLLRAHSGPGAEAPVAEAPVAEAPHAEAPHAEAG